MKIILSPAKTFNLNAKEYSLNSKFLDTTNFILENIDCLKSNQLYQAIDLYDGMVFKNLKKNGLNNDDLKFINKHFYILSALYGAVKPIDLIYPYRLDFNMKQNLGNLYNVWNDQVYRLIFDNDIILNLASSEFSKLIVKYIDSKYWIDVDFIDYKNKQIKHHSTISKKGRGLMSHYIIKNRIIDYHNITNFNLGGFSFVEQLSSENKFVFSLSC